MAAEYTAGPSDRREGEGFGREVDTSGSQEMLDEPAVQDLWAAATESGGKSLKPTETGNDEKKCGDSGQAKDPVSHEKPDGEGFYKSQEEVDRAFGRRLASERRRWEREHQEELQQLRQEIKDWEVNDTWLPQQQMYATEYAHFSDLVTQSDSLAENYPGFNLMEELNNNAAFERMVANGMSVAEAYKTVGQAPLVEKEQSIRQDERRRIMEEIENRSQNLPPIDHTPGLSGPALDITRMSEEELTRLAERVRKGDRVVI